MSNYHRATHRTKESYPKIVNHGSGTRSMGSNLEEIPRGANSTEKALEKTKVSQDKFKANQELPKKVVHVNVSKASPDIQKTLKKLKKTGKDTYTYNNVNTGRKRKGN